MKRLASNVLIVGIVYNVLDIIYIVSKGIFANL